jgi:hypothetical protein
MLCGKKIADSIPAWVVKAIAGFVGGVKLGAWNLRPGFAGS